MPGSTARRSYWDTSVFLAWLNGEKYRALVIDALLDEAAKGGLEVVTSVLSITEVAYVGAEKSAGTADPAEASRIDALWDPPSPVKLIEYHRLIAGEARDLIRKGMQRGLSLKPPDAIHLATAARHNCDEILTYDPKWLAYAAVIGVPISEPKAAQVPMIGRNGTVP